MKRFVLLTHGTHGDVGPFLALGRLLRGLGHPVTIMTHAPYEASVQTLGCDFVAVDDPTAYGRHLRRAEVLVTARPPETMGRYYADQGLFFDRMSIAGGLEQVRSEVLALLALGGDLVIIGRHTSSLSGLIAAELTGGPVCLVALSPTQLITAQVAGMHLARAAAGELEALRRGLGLGEVTRWGRWLCAADLVVGLWPQWFEEAGMPSPQPVELTDFPAVDLAAAVDTAVQTPASQTARPALTDGSVLITGGSGRMLHPDFYPVAIAGVAAAKRRAVVVTPHADLLPQPLPDGIVHVPQLPLAVSMPKAAAVVHHGGMGTLAQALSHGVPQLLLAHGGDRPDNGRRLEQLGLARSWTAQQWSAESLARELEKVETTARGRGVPPVTITDGARGLVARLEAWLAEIGSGEPAAGLGGR